MTYVIKEIWEPPNNAPWEMEIPGKGKIQLITYWLTFSDGTQAQIRQKPDSPRPTIGQELEGEMIDKVNAKGKAYKLFKKAQIKKDPVCPKCGHTAPSREFYQSGSQTPSDAPQAAKVQTMTIGTTQGTKAPQNASEEPPLSSYEGMEF